MTDALTGTKPTLRDRVNDFLIGSATSPGFQQRRRLVEGVMGRSGQDAGIVDFVPGVNIPFNAYEAGRYGTEGKYGSAALSALNVVPNALLQGAVKVGGNLTRGATRSTTDAVTALKEAPVAPINPGRRAFLGGLGAAGVAAALPKVAATKVAKAAAPVIQTIADPIASHWVAVKAHIYAADAHGVAQHFAEGNSLNTPEVMEKAKLLQEEAFQHSVGANEKSFFATKAQNPEYFPDDDVPVPLHEEHANEAEQHAKNALTNPEDAAWAADDARFSHHGAIGTHLEELSKITGRPIGELWALLPNSSSKEGVAELLLNDAHGAEMEKYNAKAHNFGAASGDNWIYSKTSRGPITSRMDYETGEVEHDHNFEPPKPKRKRNPKP